MRNADNFDQTPWDRDDGADARDDGWVLDYHVVDDSEQTGTGKTDASEDTAHREYSASNGAADGGFTPGETFTPGGSFGTWDGTSANTERMPGDTFTPGGRPSTYDASHAGTFDDMAFTTQASASSQARRKTRNTREGTSIPSDSSSTAASPAADRILFNMMCGGIVIEWLTLDTTLNNLASFTMRFIPLLILIIAVIVVTIVIAVTRNDDTAGRRGARVYAGIVLTVAVINWAITLPYAIPALQDLPYQGNPLTTTLTAASVKSSTVSIGSPAIQTRVNGGGSISSPRKYTLTGTPQDASSPSTFLITSTDYYTTCSTSPSTRGRQTMTAKVSYLPHTRIAVNVSCTWISSSNSNGSNSNGSDSDLPSWFDPDNPPDPREMPFTS